MYWKWPFSLVKSATKLSHFSWKHWCQRLYLYISLALTSMAQKTKIHAHSVQWYLGNLVDHFILPLQSHFFKLETCLYFVNFSLSHQGPERKRAISHHSSGELLIFHLDLWVSAPEFFKFPVRKGCLSANQLPNSCKLADNNCVTL